MGHAYGKIGLLKKMDIEIEDNLWKALKTLEEKEEILSKEQDKKTLKALRKNMDNLKTILGAISQP